MFLITQDNKGQYFLYEGGKLKCCCVYCAAVTFFISTIDISTVSGWVWNKMLN